MAARIASVLLLVIVAAALGYWLGGFTTPRPPEATQTPEGSGAALRLQAAPGADLPRPETSSAIYFLAGGTGEAALAVTAEEMRMAAEAGVRRFIVPALLPWEDGEISEESALSFAAAAIEARADAEVILDVTLDPPREWLDARPSEARPEDEGGPGRVSLASLAWRAGVKEGLGRLGALVEAAGLAESVRGYLLRCLPGGVWETGPGFDRTVANTEGFQAWLARRYASDTALQIAWENEAVTLDKVSVPDDEGPPSGENGAFLSLPAQQSRVDFLHYTAESVAEAIEEIAEHVKREIDADALVYATYGYTFESASRASSHLALERLLEGPVDGFLGAVSAHNRALGGVGGFTAPVDSVVARGKAWILLDDTRTGMSWSPQLGAVEAAAGVSVRSISQVQARNFAAALAHGLGVAWADPRGEGLLHNVEIWEKLAAMRTLYTAYLEDTGKPVAPPALGPTARNTVMVAVDERSRAYTQPDTELDLALLIQARDAALVSGRPTCFYLLSDVLAGRAPEVSVYLFLNAFHITPDERARLHDLFTRTQAAAIWLYAPGYIASETAVENITALTAISARKFEKTAMMGSAAAFTGNWIRKDAALSPEGKRTPLFYIEDEEATALAVYRESKRVSAAIKFLEEGWTSIYIAEPYLDPALLREALSILETPVYVTPPASNIYDTVHIGNNLIALHAAADGEREIRLPGFFDVTDWLDPAAGWPRKDSVSLSMRKGETRLLRVKPAGERPISGAPSGS